MLTQSPLFISNVFNDSAWQFSNYLTIQQAATLYINSSLLPSTPGVAQAGKLLQTNLSNSISSLNSLGLTTITQIGQYINTSTTDSTSIGTGTMITSGGLSVAKNIFCAGQSIVNSTSQLSLNSSSSTNGRATLGLTTDVSSWEFGARNSLNGTYNDSMYIYRGSYLWTMSNTGNTTFLSTSDATSSASGGALTIAGGAAVAKSLYIGSSLSCASTILQGTSTDVNPTRAISCLNSSMANSTSSYICLGRSATTNNQAEISFYLTAPNSTSNRLEFGFYGSARFLTIDATGSTNITATTDASSSSSGGTLTVSGGCAIAKKLFVGTSVNSNSATIGGTANTGGTLSITSVGYHLSMYYGSNIYGTCSVGSAGDIVLASTNGGTNTFYTFGNNGQIQLSGISARNGHKLDLGTNTSKDNILVLGQANNASPSYMLGVNNSTLEYVSGSAHAWYSNTSSTPGIVGTQNMQLTQQGSLILNNSGYHAYGSDTTGLSSINQMGAHLQVVSGTTQLLGFNYSTSSFGDMNIQSSLFYKASNGYWGIGTSSPTSILHVSGTAPQTTASGFGFLASGGAGSASGFTNRQFSIFCSGGIMCNSGEIDVLSDIRQKQKIKAIDSELAERFVMEIEPIEYCYNANPDEMHYGYSAQELVKHGYDRIVGYTGTGDEPLEEMTIVCNNGDILHLPGDTRLIVNMLNTIPLLHSALKRALERIDALENKSKRARTKKN